LSRADSRKIGFFHLLALASSPYDPSPIKEEDRDGRSQFTF
jgi:hypothetical protein